MEASPDYPALFSNDWRAAERYAAESRADWSAVFEAFEIDPRVAEAVVFPEMVRFSGLRNVAETAAVRAFYQQRGSTGADFSIGRFQMKPSFAERLEREWMEAAATNPGVGTETGADPATAALAAELGIFFDTSETIEARRARVRRLDDELWQCLYLAIFLRGSYDRRPELLGQSPERQVWLLATAYNGGEGRTFHTDFIAGPATRYYCYGDVAQCYYNSLKTTTL